MRHIIPGLPALFLACGTALAQSPPGPDPAAAALERAQAFIASSSCPAATARAAVPPAQLAADASVREASYHRILIEGCGQRMQRNYLVLVLPDGTRRMVETLPGTTVTDPILQRDAMRAAGAAASGAAPGCRQVRPQSADFDGPDSEPNVPRRTRPWAEAWVFEACGTLLSVPMRFSPSAQGGTDFVAGPEVRRLN